MVLLYHERRHNSVTLSYFLNFQNIILEKKYGFQLADTINVTIAQLPKILDTFGNSTHQVFENNFSPRVHYRLLCRRFLYINENPFCLRFSCVNLMSVISHHGERLFELHLLSV